MAHLEESTAILRFAWDWGLTGALEAPQSVTRPNPSQASTPKTESRYWKQLQCSDVPFIEDLDGRQAVWIAAYSRIDTPIWVLETTLAGVLRIRRTGPKYLLGTVTIVPETELGQVELERNTQRVKLY